MAIRRMDTEVAVVGAGPVGLMLAGELRLGGAKVVVLEKRQAPTTESRASTLHARTMEILDSRGLLTVLGTPPGEPRGHFGGIPLDLTLPSPWAGQWKVPQTETERLLQDWARDLGATIARRHELRALRASEESLEAVAAGPDGPVRVRCRYLVACDGEESAVRRLLGVGFPGQDAQRELLRADIAGLDIPNRRFQRLEQGLAIAARRGDGVTRVMVHALGTYARRRTGEPGFGEVVEAWKRVTGEDIGHGTPLWVNSFGDANRQLTRYRHGRVLFAGDAAHRQMPIGGQALNLGLQDAVNLGWKLAATVRGHAPEALLDTYHDERHAVGRRVLANIRAQALLLLGGPEAEAPRALLAELIAAEDVRTHLAGMISGLDIRYDVGGTAHPLLGARLPHATLTVAGRPCGTAQAARPGRGLLLDLTGSRAGESAAPWADRVDAVRAGPVRQGPLRGVGVALVRPDGHVVWADSTETELLGALRRWFGASAPQAERQGQ
ncbi:FAD-dependent monooxygenase [Streptomyces deccanensis]|uniref:FAD-dependent monooxygenase n=1 Tax=Streptomyces deccanensis TaxID=424188 RepID=UPI0030B867F7